MCSWLKTRWGGAWMGLTCPEPEQNLSRTWAEQVRPLTRYSQHTQAVDSRHRVAVPEQVAAVAAVLAQPPLALRFADGSVVDGQVLHLHLVCDAPGSSAIRLPEFLSPSFFFCFFPFLGPPVRLSTNCKGNPSWSLLCLQQVSGRVKTLRFSWLLSFASSPTPACSASLTTNLYGVAAAHIRLLSTAHACARRERRLSCVCVWVCVTAGNDVIFFWQETTSKIVTELFPHQ